MKQIFKFKLKDEYIPNYIEELKNEGKISNVSIVEGSKILSIDNKFLRLLKIKNVENNLSKRDKDFLELLLDDRITVFITKEEYDFMLRVSTHTTTHHYINSGISYPINRNDGWSVGSGNIITWY